MGADRPLRWMSAVARYIRDAVVSLENASDVAGLLDAVLSKGDRHG